MNTTAMLQAIHYKWTPAKNQPSLTATGAGNEITPRPWQAAGLIESKAHRNWVVNAPTGSGKTTLAELIIGDQLNQYLEVRALILVPQTQIGLNFAFEQLPLPDGSRFWQPKNLCGDDTASTTKELRQFLTAPPGHSINARVCICTYATFLLALKGLSDIPPLLVWVDEAHHTKAGDGDASENNRLGVTLLEMWKSGQHRIGLSTATLFRGDRCQMLPPEVLATFGRINLTYEAYLQSLTYLEGCRYNFVTFQRDPIAALKHTIDPEKKTIIYIPNARSLEWAANKTEQVQQVLQVLAGPSGTIQPEDSNGIIYIKRKGKKDLTVVNLVDTTNREKKKLFLGDGKTCEVDTIIALDMFKEGANWPAAELAVVIGARGSSVELVQIPGRLLRDHPAKKWVEIRHVIRWDNTAKFKEARQLINNFLKSVYLSFLLQEVIAPSCRHFQRMGWQKAQRILPKILSESLAAQLEGTLTTGTLTTIVAQHIDPEHIEETTKDILTMLTKHQAAVRGIDPEKLAVDLVALPDLVGSLATYLGEAVTPESLGRVRNLLRNDDSALLPEVTKIVRENNINTFANYKKFKSKHPELKLPANVQLPFADVLENLTVEGVSHLFQENLAAFEQPVLHYLAIGGPETPAIRWWLNIKAAYDSNRLTALQRKQVDEKFSSERVNLTLTEILQDQSPDCTWLTYRPPNEYIHHCGFFRPAPHTLYQQKGTAEIEHRKAIAWLKTLPETAQHKSNHQFWKLLLSKWKKEKKTAIVSSTMLTPSSRCWEHWVYNWWINEGIHTNDAKPQNQAA